MTDLTILDADELYALAELDMKREDISGSLEKCKVLIARNQIPVETYALLGRLYATIRLYEKAKTAFTVFLQHVPSAINEKFQLGMVERDTGNTDEAIRIWDELLESHSNFPPALYHKAVVLAEMSQIQNAVELLNTLLESAPDEDEFIPLADQLLSRLSLQ